MFAGYCKTFLNGVVFCAQDTGISVRKRVIKILRDICLEQPTFSKITEMCVRMIRRVNDEEGIKVRIHYSICTTCLFTNLIVLRHDFDYFLICMPILFAFIYIVIHRNWWMRHSRSCGLLQLQPMTKRPWPERSSTSLMWWVQLI